MSAKACQSPDATDESRALRDADGAARIEQIERMRAFEDLIVGGVNEAFVDTADSLFLIFVEQLKKECLVGKLKRIR